MDAVRLALAARAERGEVPAPLDVTLGELPFYGDTRPAAVLCLLFDHDGEANVVLTRRADHLPSHGGEVSFPGGRMRPGEPPLQAALREANEEVGLQTGSVDVIGALTPLTTRRSPALVYCFVGRFEGPNAGGQVLRADSSEVDRIFWVALARLAENGVYHEEIWPSGRGPSTGRSGGGPRPQVGAFLRAGGRRCLGRHGAAPDRTAGDRLGPGERRRLRERYPGGVMICPRCGVMNRPGQPACSRCAGSLAPAPPDARSPHPVLPITNRAEVMLRRAGGSAGPATAPPASAASAGAATQPALGAVQSDIYLLATERSTGQPAPPEALGGQTESAIGERRGRMAIGLSGA